MVQFIATILKFDRQGEKTGWTYIEIPDSIAQKLKPDTKRSFRVKGKLDEYAIKGIALLPMGGGSFIMPLNGTIRKGIRKSKGARLQVKLEFDEEPLKLSGDLLECLSDEPKALAFFKSLPKGHQNYFSKWIESAKTEQTKAKRIAQTVTALAKEEGYGEMLRSLKNNRI